MRPRVVLVTGVPGSGKSTLSRALSSALRLPYLARDDVRGGLLCTAGVWGDTLARIPPGDEAVAAFLATVETLLGHGVSCVVEYVVRTHRPDDLERLTAAGDVVVVVTECAGALERFAERNRADALVAQPALLDAVGLASVDAHTAAAVERMRTVARDMRGDFALPTLRVDTTDGCRPSLADVCRFATARHA